MYIIGITGGVGSGKTFVTEKTAELIKDKKVCKLITDDIGDRLMQPGEVCFNRILEVFSRDVLVNPLDENSGLDKALIARIVFKDPDKKRVLEEIIHPAVTDEINRVLEEEKESDTFILLESALLIDAHIDKLCDETWFVYTDSEIRRERLKESRNYSDEKIDSIMRNQKADEFYLEHCDHTVRNNGSVDETVNNILELLESIDGNQG